MQRSLQKLNDACCGTAHSSVYCSILEALEQGPAALRDIDFCCQQVYTCAVLNHNQEKL
jgi:MerR family Zn(II)-responsive transcriptional regulator of zntA